MLDTPFFKLLDSRYSSLTPKQTKIADYLRLNYKKAVFMPLAQLSKQAGVSEASFIRFARSLGYDGFAELQTVLQQHISAAMQNTLERFQSMSKVMDTDDLWRSHIQNNIRSLNMMDQLIALDDIKKLARKLTTSPKIFVAGFESTAFFAEYIVYYLSRGSLPGETITEKTGNLFSRIQQTDKNTLVIAVIVARYPNAAVQFCRDAVSRGAELCVISDTSEHPLKDITSLQFSVSTHRTEGVNMESQVNMLSFIQLLLLDAIFSENSRTETALTELEAFNKRFDIFTQK